MLKSLATISMLIVLAGCQSATMLDPALVNPTMQRVMARDDVYVTNDASLSADQKANDLRDTALLRKVLSTALGATTQP